MDEIVDIFNGLLIVMFLGVLFTAGVICFQCFDKDSAENDQSHEDGE